MNKIPTSRLPHSSIGKSNSALSNLASVRSKRLMNTVQSRNLMGVNLNEIPTVQDDDDDTGNSRKAGGFLTSNCCQALAILGISLLASGIIVASVVTPILINQNQMTTETSSVSVTTGNISTVIASSSFSNSTASTTSTSTNLTSLSASITNSISSSVSSTISTTTTSTTTSTTTTSTTTSTTTTSTTTSTTTTSTTTSTTTTSTTTSTTTTSTTTSTTTTSTTTSTTTTSTTTSTSTTTASSCFDWTWNTTGVTVAGVVGSPGSAANQFNLPWHVYVDANNTMYVADANNHRIQKWLYGATNGTTIAGTGTVGSSSTQLNTPRSVWIQGNNMYVADASNSRIQMFVNGSTAGITVASTGLGIVYFVQVDNSESIYTTDYGNSKVWKNATTFASGGGLNGPQGMYVLINGSVLIVNTQLHAVLKWDPGQSSGTVVAGTSGSAGSSATQLRYPTGAYADTNGNFWVVDNNNHRIQLFCLNGSSISSGRTVAGGTQGPGPTQLNFPVHVTFDSSWNMYVADTSNYRIQRYYKLT